MTEGPGQPHIFLPFDGWFRRIFVRDVIDAPWWTPDDTDWSDLTSELAIQYLTRLFEHCDELFAPLSDEQVNQGLWFVVGPDGGYVDSLMSREVSWPRRFRCVRSIVRLFEFFSERCSPHLSHVDRAGINPLNSICYMFWDITPIQGELQEHEELHRSIVAVMAETLALPSDACRESALHGLGHWHGWLPSEVEAVIDAFLAKNLSMRPELRDYAWSARSGNVQ